MYMLSTVISQTGECNAQHATDPCFLNQWGYSTLLLIINRDRFSIPAF